MFSAPLSDVISDVENETVFPSDFTLEQNYPNPFNPSTIIRFSLPQSETVNLKIYNNLGEEVEELLNSELGAGTHSVEFNATALASGVYYYRIEAGNFTEVKKMILLR